MCSPALIWLKTERSRPRCSDLGNRVAEHATQHWTAALRTKQIFTTSHGSCAPPLQYFVSKPDLQPHWAAIADNLDLPLPRFLIGNIQNALHIRHSHTVNCCQSVSGHQA